jgi:ribulose-5-phosphate 4-epimerase/fuculose-1-phosphate aldolase
MTEQYVGVKFKAIMKPLGEPLPVKANELIRWCRAFDEHGLAPSYGKGSAGNLSFRVTGKEFFITPTAEFLSSVKPEDLVKVVGCDAGRKEIYAKGGRKPSSESFMHHFIYRERRDVNAVFHIHDGVVAEHIEELGIPVTENEYPYGTLESAVALLKALGNSDMAFMKGHGMVYAGKSMEEAGKKALDTHEKARRLAFSY